MAIIKRVLSHSESETSVDSIRPCLYNPQVYLPYDFNSVVPLRTQDVAKDGSEALIFPRLSSISQVLRYRYVP